MDREREFIDYFKINKMDYKDLGSTLTHFTSNIVRCAYNGVRDLAFNEQISPYNI